VKSYGKLNLAQLFSVMPFSVLSVLGVLEYWGFSQGIHHSNTPTLRHSVGFIANKFSAT
jgi:hypothetical protein